MCCFCFFFNDTATTEIYTLSLHDALPILSTRDGDHLAWSFDEYVSAAGWVDYNTLLIASETRLFHFDLETGARKTVVQLEASNGLTRSNDGRVEIGRAHV